MQRHITLPTCCRLAAVALCLTACAPTPPPLQQDAASAACKAGTDARGIAAGFFALFQDRPECF